VRRNRKGEPVKKKKYRAHALRPGTTIPHHINIR